jgi:NAD(P)-dependent dehydrogenase (short-subunit alcohol dehydrogenase family)
MKPICTFFNMGWQASKQKEETMQGKTIAITGSNSGIGLRTAIGLARAGHQVIMLCRHPQRGEAARQQVIAESGNNHVDLILADMSSQQSIRQAAATLAGRYPRLDALINNAANFDINVKKPQRTADGVETIFATNHLGPFLLTTLLLPLLRQSAPARVCNIASKGLVAYPLLRIEFDNLHGERKFSAQRAYYHSKLAQIIFTYDLAERLAGSGVTVNCIQVPAVQLDEGRYDHVPAFLRAIYRFKMRFSLTSEAMAATYIRLVTAPEFAEVTGQYVDEACRPVKPPRGSQDRATWQQLWQVSEELTRSSVAIPA